MALLGYRSPYLARPRIRPRPSYGYAGLGFLDDGYLEYTHAHDGHDGMFDGGLFPDYDYDDHWDDHYGDFGGHAGFGHGGFGGHHGFGHGGIGGHHGFGHGGFGGHHGFGHGGFGGHHGLGWYDDMALDHHHHSLDYDPLPLRRSVSLDDIHFLEPLPPPLLPLPPPPPPLALLPPPLPPPPPPVIIKRELVPVPVAPDPPPVRYVRRPREIVVVGNREPSVRKVVQRRVLPEPQEQRKVVIRQYADHQDDGLRVPRGYRVRRF